MAILATLVSILVGSYALLAAADRLMGDGRLAPGLRGRVSLALLFAFTGTGHFLRTEQMAQMLPPWIPSRLALVYLTGMLEWAGASACSFRGSRGRRAST